MKEKESEEVEVQVSTTSGAKEREERREKSSMFPVRSWSFVGFPHSDGHFTMPVDARQSYGIFNMTVIDGHFILPVGVAVESIILNVFLPSLASSFFSLLASLCFSLSLSLSLLHRVHIQSILGT